MKLDTPRIDSYILFIHYYNMSALADYTCMSE